MTLPLVVLGSVIVLIAVRQVGGLRLQIWQIMLAGAAGMLLTGSIGPRDAVEAVDLDVMLFLAGMFVLGRALEDSGVLADLSFRLFSRATTSSALMALVVAGSGIASAVLMNDTVAIVGVPVVVALARSHSLDARPLLLGLAFGVTAGSVVSPNGNPQNLLVALDLDVNGAGNPFMAFARWLAIPTAIALALTYAALRLAAREDPRALAPLAPTPPARGGLARASRIALGLLLALIALRVALVGVESVPDVRLTVVALVPAGFVLLASRERVSVLRGVDWQTLLFFAALFVVVEAVDTAGVTAEVVGRLGERVDNTATILGISAALSQLVSNVPLVALYLPALDEVNAGAEAYLALAAGSTLAGNLTLIGAASNVIVVDVAERRFGVSIGFWEFTRIGVPLALAQLAATWAWLALVS
ncbi:MAG: SLC13 family permease [Dehalococcoidia bacterium]|nr:SLC13 family permease [Dehalococcoidia bacterium]